MFKLKNLKVIVFILKYFYKKNVIGLLHKEIIVSRTACLGNDIINRLFNNEIIRFNNQKSRVDMILENNDTKISIFSLVNIINRMDILSIIYTQNFNLLNFKKPKYFFIDSYSELTDQKFSDNTEKNSFYCNYSDTNYNLEIFKDNYTCEGLINLENIKDKYDSLFKKINKDWNNVHIIFIHFPTTLEKREKFKDRADLIKLAIEELSTKYENLHSISVDDTYVSAPVVGNDEYKNFPYHYHEKTYQEFVNKINKLGVINGK